MNRFIQPTLKIRFTESKSLTVGIQSFLNETTKNEKRAHATEWSTRTGSRSEGEQIHKRSGSYSDRSHHVFTLIHTLL